MNIVKKVLLSSVLGAFVAAPFAGVANAAGDDQKSEAVLFKIHDVMPALDGQGNISGCDFVVTFFNRSGKGLKDASMKLTYTDQVSEKYFADDQTQKVGQPLSFVLDVPELGSHKQMMVQQKISSNKCFLLLGEPDFEITSCNGFEEAVDNAAQQDAQRVSSRSRSARSVRSMKSTQNTCPVKFEYISSSNPEYYSEFSEISFEEQQRLLKEEKKVDLTEIKESYSAVKNNIQRANTVINSIQ